MSPLGDKTSPRLSLEERGNVFLLLQGEGEDEVQWQHFVILTFCFLFIIME